MTRIPSFRIPDFSSMLNRLLSRRAAPTFTLAPVALAAALGTLPVRQAGAQVPPVPVPPAADPAVIQRQAIENEQRIRRRTEPDVPAPDKLIEQKPAPDVLGQDATIRFQVRQIAFTPSAILPESLLRELAAPYEGREVSLAELRELVAAINAQYRARNIATAMAVIPPQEVTTGVVQIRLVEGRVGAVRIEGNASTADRYIRWRAGQAPGTLVDLPTLEADLERFNRTNEMQLRAQLEPGQDTGATDIVLVATEPERQSVRAYTDNGGSRYTGETRFGAIYTNRSLLGWRDELTLSGAAAEGYRGGSVNYSVPVTPWGTRLSYGYFHDETKIRNGPFASLGIEGTSRTNLFGLRQPLLFVQAVQLDLTVSHKRQDSDSRIDPIELSHNQTNTTAVGVDMRAGTDGNFTFAQLSFATGEGRNASTDWQDFRLVRGYARHWHDLGAALSLQVGGSFQWTRDQLLPSSEQFFIGGDGSVRGYDSAALGGYNGYTLSAELHRRLYGSTAPDSRSLGLSAFIFVDHGAVKAYAPPGTDGGLTSLTSAGLGFDLNYGKYLTARLAYGYGFNDRADLQRHQRVHFQVVAGF